MSAKAYLSQGEGIVLACEPMLHSRAKGVAVYAKQAC